MWWVLLASTAKASETGSSFTPMEGVELGPNYVTTPEATGTK